MFPFFGQPIVVNIFPQAPVLFEVYYYPGFLPLRIDDKLRLRGKGAGRDLLTEEVEQIEKRGTDGRASPLG
jgi:hypothetical protein